MRAMKRVVWFRVGWIDVVLLVMVLAFVAVSGAILWLSPNLWSSYLTMLDVRCWTLWKAIGLGIVLMQGMLVVRLWPKQK